jgi:hypothetical protein
VLSSADPVRVFQDFATLDGISNGRAEIMAGRGSFIESFPLFGYDLDDYNELFEEKLDLAARAAKVGKGHMERQTSSGYSKYRRVPAPCAESAARMDRKRRKPGIRRARRPARPARWFSRLSGGVRSISPRLLSFITKRRNMQGMMPQS